MDLTMRLAEDIAERLGEVHHCRILHDPTASCGG